MANKQKEKDPISLERKLDDILDYSKKIENAIKSGEHLGAIALLEEAPEGVCKPLGYAMLALAYVKEAEQGPNAPKEERPTLNFGGVNEVTQYRVIGGNPFTQQLSDLIPGTMGNKPREYGPRTMDAYECIVGALIAKSGEYLKGMEIHLEKKECIPGGYKSKSGTDPR